MRELLSNNSLFICQLYEDKSLALRARNLIFFTTDPGLYSKHVPIVPVLVESWSGQDYSGTWLPEWASSRKKLSNVAQYVTHPTLWSSTY